MKFKTIFMVFNLVIVLSFLSMFLLPILLLGTEYFLIFASRNWIAALLFGVTFAGVNLYFLLNWRLFRLLEGEDWSGLIRYLENRTGFHGEGRSAFALFGRGLRVRLLVNAYLLTSSVEQVRRLEALLEKRHSRFLLRHPIPFSIPYLLAGAAQDAERYFASRLAKPGLRRRDWMLWNHGFTLVQLHRFDQAAEKFFEVVDTSRDPLLHLLALYLLGSAVDRPQMQERMEREKSRFLDRWDRGRLRARIEGARANLEVLILSRILHDAMDWLYGDRADRGPDGEAGAAVGGTAASESGTAQSGAPDGSP